MTDNTLVKMEVDYSAEVDKAIPEMQSLAAAGKLTEALDQLYALEKQTRTAADAVSTGEWEDWDLHASQWWTMILRLGKCQFFITFVVIFGTTYHLSLLLSRLLPFLSSFATTFVITEIATSFISYATTDVIY